MREKEICIGENEKFVSDAIMALISILTVIPILFVFRLVLLGIANGTIF